MPHYGSLGYDGFHRWEILEGRYTLAVLFEYAGTPHAHLPLRRPHRQRRVREGTVKTKVHMHQIRAVDVEQVLAVRFGTLQHPTVELRSGRREATLRAGHRDC